MLKKIIFCAPTVLIFALAIVGCSPTVNYRGVISYKPFGNTYSPEVEINCKDRMARVVGSGYPNKSLDRIQEVSQDWRKIDEIAENASRKLETSQKSGLIGGVLEGHAFALQGAIKEKYSEVCN